VRILESQAPRNRGSHRCENRGDTAESSHQRHDALNRASVYREVGAHCEGVEQACLVIEGSCTVACLLQTIVVVLDTGVARYLAVEVVVSLQCASFELILDSEGASGDLCVDWHGLLYNRSLKVVRVEPTMVDE